jgi:hypothetical protein
MKYIGLYTGLAILIFLLWPRVSQAQIQYLSLDRQTLAVPNRSFYIEQVLDGRTDRAGIGRLPPQQGFGGAARPTDLAPSLPVALTQYLLAQLPGRPTDKPALLLVRDLRLAEARYGTGTGVQTIRQASTTLDLYLHATDGYHLVQTATNTVRPSPMLPIVYSHERNLAKVLENCLTQLAAADWSAAQSHPAQSLEELTQIGRTDVVAYPVLTGPVPAPGYFPTFLTFRNNQSVAEATLHVKTTPRTSKGWEDLPEITPLITHAGNEQELPSVWGFSDGQQLYIRHMGRYTPLARTGDSFTFKGLPDIGGADTREGSLLATISASRQPVPYTLDMVSGRASQFADAGRPTASADTARIYLYRPAGNAPTQPVFLNDQPVGELTAGHVLVLRWTDPAHEPQLRLGTEPGPPLAFMPNFRQPVYVRPVRTPHPGQPGLEIVETKFGEFDLKVIRLRARK